MDKLLKIRSKRWRLATLIMALGSLTVFASMAIATGTAIPASADTICAAGEYLSNSTCVGQTEPQLCPAGSYQPGFGTSGCIAAAANFFVPSPGSAAEIPCSAGTFQPSTGQTACLPDLAISTTSVPNGTVGTAYSETLAATGGTAPYGWQVTGPLPSGLTLDSETGMISGTPARAASRSR